MTNKSAAGETLAAFQDAIPGNHCFGCGPQNSSGLGIKSYWQEPEVASCRYQPLPQHSAGPEDVLNGGIIATLIDCHSICTAIASLYKQQDRAIGSDPHIWCVTGSLEIRYIAPAFLSDPVDLTARIVDTSGRKTIVNCSLNSGETLCATALIVAIQVPPEWRGVRS